MSYYECTPEQRKENARPQSHRLKAMLPYFVDFRTGPSAFRSRHEGDGLHRFFRLEVPDSGLAFLLPKKQLQIAIPGFLTKLLHA